jgi:geranylgeranyl pyrophosphate synthase
MHVFGLMVDDMIDGSKFRRELPASYARSDVGLSGINDAIMLENINCFMLKKYFYETNHYDPILLLLQDTSMMTILGQGLDTRISIPSDFSG